MFFEQYEHEPAIAVARFLIGYSGRPEDYDGASRRAADGGYRALDTMERHLADRTWFVGDR